MEKTIKFLFALLIALAPAAQATPTEYEQFKSFLDEVWQDKLQRSPETAAFFGLKLNQDKWDDGSIAADQENHQQDLVYQQRLKTFDFTALPARGKLQYQIIDYRLNRDIDRHRWRFHNYVVSQEDSPLDDKAAFLINIHAINSHDDAVAFIERVKGIPKIVEDTIGWLDAQSKHGTHPPQFVYPKVIENSEGLLAGQPFTESAFDATLLSAFKRKVADAGMSAEEQQVLITSLNQALLKYYQPAMTKYIAALTEHQKKATIEDGVWKHPDGKDFYNSRLKLYTTIDVTADEVHETGLKEVARLSAEIRGIQKKLGHKGDLSAFLTYMREDPQFYFPETDEGRAQYLAATAEAIDRIKLRVDDYFTLKPKADLIIKRVEAFREKNTSAAFYNAPAMDGSRPGIYYVPLYRMKDNSKWDMITTAYHEAIPGHHMQIAIAQELPETPILMKTMFVGAYVEGWALYAEHLAGEMGMYEQDPIGDFGRLASEMFRAVRLVVDTGIHAKQWTRQQAVTYMVQNTSLTENYVRGEIDRYTVWPGQATSYKIGMLKILELRETAKSELGEKFDIRQFHEVVLSDGQVPLPILTQKVNAWVASRQ